MEGNTAFISYVLIPSGITAGYYSQAIHCNYIKKINLGTTDPYIQEISLNFPRINMDYFKFLGTSRINTSTPLIGYNVNRISAIVQIVSNYNFDTFEEVVPDSTAWKRIDVTSQVTGFSASTTWVLTPANITSVVFKISLLQYNNPSIFIPYTLSYLSYPSSSQTDKLVFGDSTYFFGNVSGTIKAEVYTTDISVNLPLNEFNSSSNKTWNGYETVYISEIGIYDINKNLVAIGKLNDPVAKDSTIARTIVFAMDF
jgi:hypothetical protein